MTELIVAVVKEVLAQETMNVKAFDRTGCMLRLCVHDDKDAKVKPQSLKLLYNIPTEY
jgi:hypothetical protein